MTSHGGHHSRINVAERAAQKIIGIASELPSEDPLFVLCVTVLCHTCKLAICSAQTSDVALIQPSPCIRWILTIPTSRQKQRLRAKSTRPPL